MFFYATTTEINKSDTTLKMFEHLKGIAEKERNGYCYYKYPMAGGNEAHTPEIVLIDLQFGISAFDLYNYSIELIDKFEENEWIINDERYDSPLLILEDYKINLLNKYQKYRVLRNKIKISYFVIFPFINKSQFQQKFPNILIDNIIFNDYLKYDYSDFFIEKSDFTEQESLLFKSISQGAGSLNSYTKTPISIQVDKIGEAIKLIDCKLSSLDEDQHAAAIQIPDGPQRIKKILYTFHTQSLYNQIKNLITKFYRETEEKDPDWDNLKILHSYGGRTVREGVYYRTCLRNSVIPLSYGNNKDNSLEVACKDILGYNLLEEFDYVLIDEAQDLPSSFYQLIYNITKAPKRIIFAYDELQNLTDQNVQDTGELFGYHNDGSKKVDFSKGSYGNGIEMDYTLKKSYRNPYEVLMVAHSLGLGIYNKDGLMQIIDDKHIWETIGYLVKSGNFNKKERMIIERPLENSLSIVHEFYKGKRNVLTCKNFNTRQEELDWVANSIKEDIINELVQPHHIVVITLDNQGFKENYTYLQNKLFELGIPSIIPGIGGVERDKFGEEGYVTLSTVFKAKGNETFIVYVTKFDYLYDYTDFVQVRNRAFTSITRTKGWCNISGIGARMQRAIQEIETTKKLIPNFDFIFPDPKYIAKKLSTEEQARRLEKGKVINDSAKKLINMKDEELNALSEEDISKLMEKLIRAKSNVN